MSSGQGFFLEAGAQARALLWRPRPAPGFARNVLGLAWPRLGGQGSQTPHLRTKSEGWGIMFQQKCSQTLRLRTMSEKWAIIFPRKCSQTLRLRTKLSLPEFLSGFAGLSGVTGLSGSTGNGGGRPQDRTTLPHAPGPRMMVVQNKLPQINIAKLLYLIF